MHIEAHDLVADLKRVSHDLGRAPTRTEYRQFGRFPDSQIERVFGTFGHGLMAAGLTPKRKETPKGDLLFETQIEKYDINRALLKRFESEIQPYTGSYEKKKGRVTIMIRSDDHAQWVDPFCNDVFFDVALRLQPDIINFAGDTNDFWKISNHSKNPRRQMSMQSEINFVKKHFFELARQVCPNTQIDWLLGNHEWRLFRYLSEQAPALATLECLQFDRLFNLKEYGINLIARPSFLAPTKGNNVENYHVYQDAFVVTHGTRLGKQPAQEELGVWGKSGTSGHVHRYTTFSKRDLNGFHRWTTNGAMCALKSGEEYIYDLVNWTQGFNIVHIENGRVFQEYIDLTQGFACVGGVYYTREDLTRPNSGLILPE